MGDVLQMRKEAFERPELMSRRLLKETGSNPKLDFLRLHEKVMRKLESYVLLMEYLSLTRGNVYSINTKKYKNVPEVMRIHISIQDHKNHKVHLMKKAVSPKKINVLKKMESSEGGLTISEEADKAE